MISLTLFSLVASTLGLDALLGALGGGDKACSFSCSDSSSPVGQKRGHVPQSNGCGSMGITFTSEFGATPCCDEHDHCYHMCHLDDPAKARERCDAQFKKCLMSNCKKHPKSKRAACKQEGNLLSSGVVAFGCSSYLESQEDACDCSHAPPKQLPGSKKPKRTRPRNNDEM